MEPKASSLCRFLVGVVGRLLLDSGGVDGKKVLVSIYGLVGRGAAISSGIDDLTTFELLRFRLRVESA